MKRTYSLLLVLPLMLGAACSKSDAPPPQTKTKAQRDSAIANSSLPGAKGVGMAMKAADSDRLRQAQLDSASKP